MDNYWKTLYPAEPTPLKPQPEPQDGKSTVEKWLREREEKEKVEAARIDRNQTTVALTKQGAARLRAGKLTAASDLLMKRQPTTNEDGIEIVLTFNQKQAELLYPYAIPESQQRLRETFPTITDYVKTDE